MALAALIAIAAGMLNPTPLPASEMVDAALQRVFVRRDALAPRARCTSLDGPRCRGAGPAELVLGDRAAAAAVAGGGAAEAALRGFEVAPARRAALQRGLSLDGTLAAIDPLAVDIYRLPPAAAPHLFRDPANYRLLDLPALAAFDPPDSAAVARAEDFAFSFDDAWAVSNATARLLDPVGVLRFSQPAQVRKL